MNLSVTLMGRTIGTSYVVEVEPIGIGMRLLQSPLKDGRTLPTLALQRIKVPAENGHLQNSVD